MKFPALFGILLVVCVCPQGCSQNAPANSVANSGPTSTAEETFPPLLPVKVSGKWGYVNTDGNLVINPQFDSADDFHEGRAVVCLGKPCSWWNSGVHAEERWGYIDTSGKVVVTPQYAAASDFSEGLAAVCTGDCFSNESKGQSRGYIGRDGKVSIPFQFGVASSFSEGLASVCVGPCSWTEQGGYNGKFGFIDHSGHFVINPQFDNVMDFKDGFARVTLGKGDQSKFGYVDKTGKVIWQPSN